MPQDAAAVEPRLGLGGNFPPGPLDTPIDTLITADPAVLEARLGKDYAKMLARFAELEVGAGQVPVVDTDDKAKKIVDWVAQQVRPLQAEADAAHRTEKKPYLECGRVVDTFFLRRLERLLKAIADPINRAEDYRKQKEAALRAEERRRAAAALAEQQRREAEAQRLQDEAQKKAPADRAGANELMARSQEQKALAEVAASAAAAPPEPVRIHGEYGATGFSQEKWDYEVDDPALIPLGYLTLDHEAVRAAIAEGVREIPGLRIFPREKFIIRRC